MKKLYFNFLVLAIRLSVAFLMSTFPLLSFMILSCLLHNYTHHNRSYIKAVCYTQVPSKYFEFFNISALFCRYFILFIFFPSLQVRITITLLILNRDHIKIYHFSFKGSIELRVLLQHCRLS